MLHNIEFSATWLRFDEVNNSKANVHNQPTAKQLQAKLEAWTQPTSSKPHPTPYMKIHNSLSSYSPQYTTVDLHMQNKLAH